MRWALLGLLVAGAVLAQVLPPPGNSGGPLTISGPGGSCVITTAAGPVASVACPVQAQGLMVQDPANPYPANLLANSFAQNGIVSAQGINLANPIITDGGIWYQTFVQGFGPQPGILEWINTVGPGPTYSTHVTYNPWIDTTIFGGPVNSGSSFVVVHAGSAGGEIAWQETSAASGSQLWGLQVGGSGVGGSNALDLLALSDNATQESELVKISRNGTAPAGMGVAAGFQVYAAGNFGFPANFGTPLFTVDGVNGNTVIDAGSLTLDGVVMPHDQRGCDAGTAGLLSVTFKVAYAGQPSCTCSDTSATLTACDVTARSTAGATFKTTGTDTVCWTCGDINSN